MQQKDLSIGHRLFIGFGMAFVLLLVQILVTFAFLQRIRTLESRQDGLIAPRREAAEAMHAALLEQAVVLRSYALTRDPQHLSGYRRAARDATRHRDELGRLPKQSAGEDLFAEIGILLQGYTGDVERFIALVGSGADEQELHAAEARLTGTREALLSRVRDFTRFQQKSHHVAQTEITAARRKMLTWLIALAVLLLFSTFGVAGITLAAVRRPVRRLVKAARALEAGQYESALAEGGAVNGSASTPGQPPRDELRELAGAFARMTASLRSREMRVNADARVARASAASIDVERIAGDALREVVDHVGCELGALYIADSDDGMLTRVAGHALDGEPRRIPGDEGIPGQALADGRSMVVRKIPEDTPFRVRLGVENVPPRTVAVTPILFRDEGIGVLLLGSIRDIDDGEISFIEHCATQLGVSLRNAMAHREVTRLVGELQEKNEELEAQNEELQAQSEEIQAQNEELQGQSEEIHAQNEELQAQAEEIHAQNEELRTQAEKIREHIEILEQARSELADRNKALAKADQQKNEFVAMLAHELRNPLAAIANASHLLGRPATTDPRVAMPQAVISRQTDHLARLVDDLLDVSRITRGAIELRSEWLDIGAVMSSAVEATRSCLAAREHRLSVSLPAEPLHVFGDPARLEQVLTNLLTNAAKYTPQEGHVSVSVERDEDTAVIQVRDTGQGIPREMLPRIFDLFVQADRSLDRTEGGLGIGLTMVRRLVEMHGGQAEAHSDGPGQGSTFTIRLPIGTPQEEDDPMQPSLRGDLQADSKDDNVVRRVLVVDDNRDAAETLVALVELWGHEARAAHDGPSAIDIARRYRPDTILLDIGLPGMDGYEVAKRLRSEGSATKTFLAAVTGYGEDSARQQSEEAGFDCHLTKPVDPEALRDLLARGGTD